MLVAAGRERRVARPERPTRRRGRRRYESAAASTTRRRRGCKRRQTQRVQPAGSIDEIEHAADAVCPQSRGEPVAIWQLNSADRRDVLCLRRREGLAERIDNGCSDDTDREQRERNRPETRSSTHGQGQSVPTASGCPATALARAAMPVATARRSSSSVGPAGPAPVHEETNAVSSAT